MIGNCEICDSIYRKTAPVQKYCKNCRVIVEKENKRRWHNKNYKKKAKKPRVCEYCGTNKDVWNYKKSVMLCKSHYHEMYNTGKIKPESEKGYKNNIVYAKNHIEIHFKNGGIGLFDKEDEEIILKTYWGMDVGGYIHGKIDGRLARYHRHLFNFPKETIDHINRDKLDNRKINLRLCTPKENSRNLSVSKNNNSGVTGVRRTKGGKWQARIMVDRKEKHLGNFETLRKATEVRRAAELKYFGEFAPIHK